MAIKWETRPSDAIGALADAQSIAIHDAALQIALRYVEPIGTWLNEAIPWHPVPWSLHAEEPEEPLDMFAYVEDDGKNIHLHLSHGDYFGSPVEETLDKELSYVPDGVDHWGPIVMSEVMRSMRV